MKGEISFATAGLIFYGDKGQAGSVPIFAGIGQNPATWNGFLPETS